MKGIALAAALLTALVGCRHPASETANVLEAGSDTFDYCTGPRPFTFDYGARDLSLPNAFWLSVLAAHAYTTKPVVVDELKRLGFKDPFFFDEDGVTRNVLRTGLDFRWASTQGFWAERPEGVILSFRGTNPTEMGDLVSDLMATQSSLMAIGAQTIGTVADAAIAAAGDLPGGQTQAMTDINVHKGFWHALDIVWKHIETRATAIYAAERPKEKAAKLARLDELATKLATQGEAALKPLLAADRDWTIDVAGKLKLLKLWRVLGNDQAKRSDLFEVIDRAWASWQRPFFVTGHSLGGALATIASYRLMKMGLNVRGLYTFGSPRVGNRAFTHDFRVLAFNKGLKAKGTPQQSGEGGLNRFVHRLDLVARVPPVFGATAAVDVTNMNGFLDKWSHVSKMRYLQGDELWIEGNEAFDATFAAAKIPEYLALLPVEKWKQWIGDHMTPNYAGKLEKLAFGVTPSPCGQ